MGRKLKLGLALALGAACACVGAAAMRDRAALASAERMCAAVRPGMSRVQVAGLAVAGSAQFLGAEAADRTKISVTGWHYSCGCSVIFKSDKVAGAAGVICID
ncbi:MAG: hypothetical protein EPO01_10230 [Aquabacterium sp.]|nr:MAG: hypothetical protein EPO12_05840 [Aquabacterium sp.]TAL21791.1 MAG: hypothetical protein EPO01_10230 [Aquabacterium sp.]